MKVFTVTYLNQNYGSILQAYALQNRLKEFCAEPVVVIKQEKSPSLIVKVKRQFNFLKPKPNYSLTLRFKLQIQKKKFIDKQKKLSEFINQNIDTIRIIDTEKFSKTIHKEDILLAGSDQIWSIVNGSLSDWYTFQWKGLSDSQNRVSYAASIGLSELSAEQKEQYRTKLCAFKVVSFREKQAVTALSSSIQCPVRHDLDPTLLYSSEFWSSLASPRIETEPYIFVYMLRPDEMPIKMAQKLAEIKKCKVIYTGLLADHYRKVETVCNAGIQEFLSYILHAKYVITNSFHGTVFSILFKKQFLNVRISMTSSRAENLLALLKLDNRLVKNEYDLSIIDSPINYHDILKKLEAEREKSLMYLKWICSDEREYQF